MNCKSVLFYNGMQHAAIRLEEVETLAVDAFSFMHVHCMISKQCAIKVMVVNGMFLLSCRIKILGKICDRQRFLIDTFFVLFRSCLG